MLSRTASHLFWMARYIERAENVTRIMNVARTFALMPESRGGTSELKSPLDITGLSDIYADIIGDEITYDNICKFFICSEGNPGSIARSLTLARENAHAVRGTITSDIWECLNEAYLSMNAFLKKGLTRDNSESFFDNILEHYQLYFGAMMSTMQRNDAYNFTMAGHMVERADNTARAMIVKFAPEKKKTIQDNAIDYYQLTSLLRAMSANVAYHTSYGDAVIPENVAELLILSKSLPRSLVSCTKELNNCLTSIEGDLGLIPKRLTAELNASLSYSTIEQCMNNGLGQFLNRFLTRISHIGIAIHRAYLEVA